MIYTPYKKIYTKNYGPIPKEANGRSYEVHHIDGNHTNNDPKNLKAIPIQEHYDIHYTQGDWGACQAIAIRMKQLPQEISELAKKANQKKVKDGNHHWLGPLNNIKNNAKRMVEGNHNFLINNPGLVEWQCPICCLRGRGVSNKNRHFNAHVAHW